MPGDTTSPALRGYHDEGAWREIEVLIEEASSLAATPMSGREFHIELLRRLMQATGAVVVASWSSDRQGDWQLDYQAGQSAGVTGVAAEIGARTDSIVGIVRQGLPQILPPSATARDGERNPIALTRLVQPIVVDSDPLAALEVYAHPDIAPTELRNLQRVVASFAEVVADFHRRRLLREFRGREHTWGELDQFAWLAHRSLDFQTTAFTIANEAVRAVGCDRVTVLTRSGNRCRVVAVSGVDTVQRRAAPIRAVEALATAVARSREPLWYATDSESLPPHLEQCLQQHLDASHVRAAAIVPLQFHEPDGKTAAACSAVLVLERFEGQVWNDQQRRRVLAVCRHSASALQNAQTLSSLPLRFLSEAIRKLSAAFRLNNLPKTAFAAAVLAGLTAALILVPADFNISARGELQPATLRHIFAPADGVVEQVHVAHGQTVTANDPLVKLRRADLELELSRILGELQTTQRRFDAVRSARLSFSIRETSNAADFDELTAEEERLKTMLVSLEQQRDLWLREQQELVIDSPIAGEVLTWNLADLLANRPVHRGQRLMTVADSRGEWRLQLQVADHDVEHIRAAQRSAEVPVKFMMASHSGQSFEGVLEKVGIATETGDDRRPFVRLVVKFDPTQIPGLHPGATVFAQVHCGRRPLGYVWFRELIDVVRTRLWI